MLPPNSSVVDPTFLRDVPGEYIVQLIVNDGTSDSDPDEVTITAVDEFKIPPAMGRQMTDSEFPCRSAGMWLSWGFD